MYTQGNMNRSKVHVVCMILKGLYQDGKYWCNFILFIYLYIFFSRQQMCKFYWSISVLRKKFNLNLWNLFRKGSILL